MNWTLQMVNTKFRLFFLSTDSVPSHNFPEQLTYTKLYRFHIGVWPMNKATIVVNFRTADLITGSRHEKDHVYSEIKYNFNW